MVILLGIPARKSVSIETVGSPVRISVFVIIILLIRALGPENVTLLHLELMISWDQIPAEAYLFLKLINEIWFSWLNIFFLLYSIMSLKSLYYIFFNKRKKK